jgi:hypothetical protein
LIVSSSGEFKAMTSVSEVIRIATKATSILIPLLLTTFVLCIAIDNANIVNIGISVENSVTVYSSTPINIDKIINGNAPIEIL